MKREKNKRIRVRLRLGRSPHPMYLDLIAKPPKNVVFIYPPVQHYSIKPNFTHKVKVFFWNKLINFFPPTLFIKDVNADLIHSASGTLILNKIPWVTDSEGVFVSYNYLKMNNKHYIKQLYKQLSNENCKFILPWSKASLKSFQTIFGNKLDHKLRVVYPAKIISKHNPINKREDVTLIFVGRRFWDKGGYETLCVYEKLSRNFKNLKLYMISEVPKEIKSKFRNKNIIYIKPNMTYDALAEYYKRSDIFIFPTFVDTFGFVFLEAMEFKLPIVTLDVFATSEIVKHKYNGIVLPAPITPYAKNIFDISKWQNYSGFLKYLITTKDSSERQELVDNLEIVLTKLLRSKALRQKYGRNGYKLVSKGKFSIEERNKKLYKVYQESLKIK
ncbi:MAG: hypothetical protein DRM99_00470 [Thermoplasmata archaeon]|nr:MAG: hypothetical protein DRM99_00470 [Thermoplasmata archaeon]